MMKQAILDCIEYRAKFTLCQIQQQTRLRRSLFFPRKVRIHTTYTHAPCVVTVPLSDGLG